MKDTAVIIVCLFVALFSSCSDRDSLCHQEESIEALRFSLTESVVQQSDFLTREYGLQSIEDELKGLFSEDKIQISSIDAMHTKVIDSMLVCT